MKVLTSYWKAEIERSELVADLGAKIATEAMMASALANPECRPCLEGK